MQFAIATHLPARGEDGMLPSSRNHINVLTSDVIVALPGGAGTRTELLLAQQYGRPVVIYGVTSVQVAAFPGRVPRVHSIEQVEEFLRSALM